MYACILLGFTRARQGVAFAKAEASHGLAAFSVHRYKQEEQLQAAYPQEPATASYKPICVFNSL